MVYIEVLLLSLALAADAFSVGAMVGLNHHGKRQAFRLSFHFGLFQSLFALSGVIAGVMILSRIERWDHWIAFSLLVFIGVKMIFEGIRGHEEQVAKSDLTKGISMVSLSVAVSIDALAAGIGLSALDVSLVFAVVSVGLVATLATLLAMKMASFIPKRFGKRSEIVAGFVLIGLGIKILFEHLGFIPG